MTEMVQVPAHAVAWLKEYFPSLCVKAGMCEIVAGRLYTRSALATSANAPVTIALERLEAAELDAADQRALAEGLQAGADSLRSSPWLPIDRAPKGTGQCLVSSAKDWCQAYYWRGQWRTDEGGVLDPQPTHYMPIPPLPEVKP